MTRPIFKPHTMETNVASRYALDPDKNTVLDVWHCPTCDIEVGDEIVIPQIFVYDGKCGYEDGEDITDNCCVCGSYDNKFINITTVKVVATGHMTEGFDRDYKSYKVLEILGH